MYTCCWINDHPSFLLATAATVPTDDNAASLTDQSTAAAAAAAVSTVTRIPSNPAHISTLHKWKINPAEYFCYKAKFKKKVIHNKKYVPNIQNRNTELKP